MDDLLSLHTPTEYFLRLLLCSPTKRGHERQICFNLNQQLVCLPLACWDRSLLASPPPEHPFFCMLGFDALLSSSRSWRS